MIDFDSIRDVELSRHRRSQLVVAIIALSLLLPVGVVVAQTLTHSASSGVEYSTNSGVNVTLGDQRDVSSTPFDDANTWNSSDLRISGSDADIEVTDASFNSYPITARNIDVRGSLTVERLDLNKQFTVESGDANILQVRNYTVDDGTEDLAYDSNNGLTITLSGLPQIGVAAVDADTGNALDTAAVGGGGTATFTLPAGTQSIRLEPAPSDLRIYNERKPNQLIDGNVSLRVRLFAGGEVIQRKVTDGTVSLSGVPLDEELVITVKEQNTDYVYRRILVESAVQTSEIYLLPTNTPAAEVEFQIRDDTGRFGGDNTKLFVEKPITKDYDNDGTNETRYQTIAGDRLGGDGTFPTILEDSERYRLRIENDAGETRVLGSYTVQGAERVTLPIGKITFKSDIDEGPALQTELRKAPDGVSYDHEIRLVYVDPEAKTDSIEISIKDQNGNTIRPTSTENVSGAELYAETYPIRNSSWDPEQDTAIVQVEAKRNLQTITFEKTLGDVPDIFGSVPLSTQAIELISLGSIVAVGGLTVIISAPLAALVTAGYAGLLSLVGLVPIPMPAVVLAGLVGIVASVGSRRL